MGWIDTKKYLNYNVSKYINLCTEARRVTVDGILMKYGMCKKYDLSADVSDYLKYISEEPFYVPTDISDVKTNSRVSTLNPKFILFSAPGATGKSALAEYMAYKKQALYWNLAKLKLGTNSFAGSILQAVGPENYSDFIINLNAAKVMLVIDAFDEAEIISGRKMLSSFIDDISRSLNHHVEASVVFLARTETAQYIASFCAENDIPLAHYEIGFFNEVSAKEFITRLVVEKPATPTQADLDCVNAYYVTVKKNITEEECRSFLGYAPVLQAIAEHIKSRTNRAKLISELASQCDCVTLIMSIMTDLLGREQKKKLVAAFKERCQEAHPEFNDWDKVYGEEEQLVRIVNYILFDDQKYSNYFVAELPPQLIEDYQEMLEIFLPQHPFIRRVANRDNGGSFVDFTGPAFRDYTLARIILSKEYDELAQMYFEESQSKSYFPSQIFFDCYKALAGDTVCASHISYVYDSYRAKATALERPYLQCSCIPADEGDTEQHVAVFGMTSDPKKTDVPKRTDIELELKVEKQEICFDQLANVAIDEPNLIVRIGRAGIDSRIASSSVIAKEIWWGTRSVTIESYKPEGCLLVAREAMRGENPSIEISGGENLRVSAPNVHEYYRLIAYKYDFEDSTSLDVTKLIHALRCILVEFRAHRKDTLAKTAERIEFVTVGSSKIKRDVLEYLKESKIIYEEAHLYKIDEAKMQEKGIFFSALARNDEQALFCVFNDFGRWKNNKLNYQ